jgi:hypothetical protein
MSGPHILHNWAFDFTRAGSLYCSGTLANNRVWETTQILELITMEDHYQVRTRNSTYLLYW